MPPAAARFDPWDWREAAIERGGRPLAGQVAALIVLLSVFQLILPPGIPFD